MKNPRSSRGSPLKLLVILAGMIAVVGAVARLLPHADKASGAARAGATAPLELAPAPAGAPSAGLAPGTNLVPFGSLPAPNVIALALADQSMTPEDRVSFMVNQGSAYLADRRPDDALAMFEVAAQLKPEDEDLHFNRGIALARLGRLDEAKKAYEDALQLFPDYAEAHNNLGNLLASQGNLPEAAQHFEASIKLSPENASAHNNLGSVLAREKQYAQALDHFLLATRYQTNYIEAHFNVGGAYLELGRLDEAAAKFTEILQVHPDFSAAQAGLERVRRRQAQ